jgi:hypothetical protein
MPAPSYGDIDNFYITVGAKNALLLIILLSLVHVIVRTADDRMHMKVREQWRKRRSLSICGGLSCSNYRRSRHAICTTEFGQKETFATMQNGNLKTAASVNTETIKPLSFVLPSRLDPVGRSRIARLLLVAELTTHLKFHRS